MRRSLKIIIAGVALVGATGVYVHYFAAPACDSEETLAKVQTILRDEFHLTGIFFNNIHTASGLFFSRRRECITQITEIRGNITAADMPWKNVRFRIEPGSSPDGTVVTVKLGEGAPLEAPHQSLWEQLLAHF